jgi:uncharacterized NAD-dependent epimerase/dehydratase family protein
LVADALCAIEAGLNVASGLHQRLRDEPLLREAAQRRGVQLFDVRDAPDHLPVGSGKNRAGHRLLTVGTDCSVGKMYTTLALVDAMRKRGLAADFRATGQTGILIAGEGVPLDAVVADFISGAIEELSPARHDGGWDVIEGQGSLFHPPLPVCRRACSTAPSPMRWFCAMTWHANICAACLITTCRTCGSVSMPICRPPA